jgi:hypothetical protein
VVLHYIWATKKKPRISEALKVGKPVR